MAQYGSDQNYGSAGLDMVALRPWYGKRYTDTWYHTAMVLLYCYGAVLMVCYPFSSDFTNLDSNISVTLCHTWSAHALHAAIGCSFLELLTNRFKNRVYKQSVFN